MPGRRVPVPRPLVPRLGSAPARAVPPRVTRPPTTALLAPTLDAPASPPPGLDSKQLAAWHVAQIHAHEELRARSFYDTGHHLIELLALRSQLGAKDIKELCSKVDLGMSHMTANKYLQVARSFDRETAVETGIEKCYALTVYAKAIGRPGDAAAILARDEVVRGARGLRTKTASASKLYAAVRALKEAARVNREPTEIQAARERTAKATAAWVKKLGFRGAHTEVVRRGGEPRVAIYISLETAERLESRVLGAVARLGPRLARTQPELFAPLRAAGWRLTGSG
ncbi:MAG: hypothetical protein KC619_25230 [Myxococcales bacterium]|nr:hypothetical protein [Myxococcales bacterium]